MISIEVQHYLGRARDFLKGMDLLKEDLFEFRYSAALLGIHGAIGYCDALRIGLGSENLSSDNHDRAIADLHERLTTRRFENRDGVKRLERLLAKKSKIAYGAEASTASEIGLVVELAERFAVWAETTGKNLRIEGWIHD